MRQRSPGALGPYWWLYPGHDSGVMALLFIAALPYDRHPRRPHPAANDPVYHARPHYAHI